MSKEKGGKLSSEYEWQKTRRRADAPPGLVPIRGYGPNGEYTLYAPSSESARKRKFVDGKPEIEVIQPIQDAEIIELRDKVLNTFRVERNKDLACVLFADLSLLNYSAAILRKVYNLSDDDLTMLHSGDSWIQPVMIHVIGGAKMVEVWRRAPELVPISGNAAPEIPDSFPTGFGDSAAPVHYPPLFQTTEDSEQARTQDALDLSCD